MPRIDGAFLFWLVRKGSICFRTGANNMVWRCFPALSVGAITVIQLFFVAIIGFYLWTLLKQQQGNKLAVKRESRKEIDRLATLRAISLSEPLSERTRPTSFTEIIGQEQGLKALRAALCGPNPQHVIIYGPAGVGKTAAARLVLDEAKANEKSPFGPDAKFVELDATTARFDERGIADPLIGSVHDPIYQGAGALGMQGIPQPKPGAVTRAHGGILFIDEIGELHPVQMNKLLKVLEDRKVFLESAYYSSENPNVPAHIRDIFENGLPADFRLVGATTRMPEELPPAIRSRCIEIFFRELTPDEIMTIAANAAAKIKVGVDEGTLEVIGRFARNGREAVNLIQISASIADLEGRNVITQADVEWVINNGQYSPRPERRIPASPQIGVANSLAVYGPNSGLLMELEVVAYYVGSRQGRVTVSGMVDEEEIGGMGRPLKRRKSTARSSVENVLTALRQFMNENPFDYDIHVNFPGGIPVDGPSAGVALAVAIYSAILKQPVDNRVAMTGEVSARGLVKPVGGVIAKIAGAINAGAHKILIPRENDQKVFKEYKNIEIIPIDTIQQALEHSILARPLQLAIPNSKVN